MLAHNKFYKIFKDLQSLFEAAFKVLGLSRLDRLTQDTGEKRDIDLCKEIHEEPKSMLTSNCIKRLNNLQPRQYTLLEHTIL